MSATDTFENQILGLILTGSAIPAIADNAASTPVTNLYISLHTANPGEGGTQATSEAAYTGYSRAVIARSGTGWTVVGGVASNNAPVSFGQCTASPGGNITHVGIGTAASGAGTLLLYDALDTAIVMQVGTSPFFPAGELDVAAN